MTAYSAARDMGSVASLRAVLATLPYDTQLFSFKRLLVHLGSARSLAFALSRCTQYFIDLTLILYCGGVCAAFRDLLPCGGAAGLNLLYA